MDNRTCRKMKAEMSYPRERRGKKNQTPLLFFRIKILLSDRDLRKLQIIFFKNIYQFKYYETKN